MEAVIDCVHATSIEILDPGPASPAIKNLLQSFKKKILSRSDDVLPYFPSAAEALLDIYPGDESVKEIVAALSTSFKSRETA
jgi:hypothetical protein